MGGQFTLKNPEMLQNYTDDEMAQFENDLVNGRNFAVKGGMTGNTYTSTMREVERAAHQDIASMRTDRAQELYNSSPNSYLDVQTGETGLDINDEVGPWSRAEHGIRVAGSLTVEDTKKAYEKIYPGATVVTQADPNGFQHYFIKRPGIDDDWKTVNTPGASGGDAAELAGSQLTMEALLSNIAPIIKGGGYFINAAKPALGGFLGNMLDTISTGTEQANIDVVNNAALTGGTYFLGDLAIQSGLKLTNVLRDSNNASKIERLIADDPNMPPLLVGQIEPGGFPNLLMSRLNQYSSAIKEAIHNQKIGFGLTTKALIKKFSDMTEMDSLIKMEGVVEKDLYKAGAEAKRQIELDMKDTLNINSRLKTTTEGAGTAARDGMARFALHVMNKQITRSRKAAAKLIDTNNITMSYANLRRYITTNRESYVAKMELKNSPDVKANVDITHLIDPIDQELRRIMDVFDGTGDLILRGGKVDKETYNSLTQTYRRLRDLAKASKFAGETRTQELANGMADQLKKDMLSGSNISGKTGQNIHSLITKTFDDIDEANAFNELLSVSAFAKHGQVEDIVKLAANGNIPASTMRMLMKGMSSKGNKNKLRQFRRGVLQEAMKDVESFRSFIHNTDAEAFAMLFPGLENRQAAQVALRNMENLQNVYDPRRMLKNQAVDKQLVEVYTNTSYTNFQNIMNQLGPDFKSNMKAALIQDAYESSLRPSSTKGLAMDFGVFSTKVDEFTRNPKSASLFTKQELKDIKDHKMISDHLSSASTLDATGTSIAAQNELSQAIDISSPLKQVAAILKINLSGMFGRILTNKGVVKALRAFRAEDYDKRPFQVMAAVMGHLYQEEQRMNATDEAAENITP